MALSTQIEKLYTRALTAAQSFKDYNFREYFVQHVHDDFTKINSIEDTEELKIALLKQEDNTEMLERQGLINAMYNRKKNIVEQ